MVQIWRFGISLQRLSKRQTHSTDESDLAIEKSALSILQHVVL